MARIALSVLNEQNTIFRKAGKQHDNTKKALSYLSPVGRTHARYREDKVTMHPEKKTLERTWQWLNVAVSPSLKLMDKIGKLDNRDYIRQLIERGQMNEEQQRIYEDYKKSFL